MARAAATGMRPAIRGTTDAELIDAFAKLRGAAEAHREHAGTLATVLNEFLTPVTKTVPRRFRKDLETEVRRSAHDLLFGDLRAMPAEQAREIGTQLSRVEAGAAAALGTERVLIGAIERARSAVNHLSSVTPYETGRLADLVASFKTQAIAPVKVNYNEMVESPGLMRTTSEWMAAVRRNLDEGVVERAAPENSGMPDTRPMTSAGRSRAHLADAHAPYSLDEPADSTVRLRSYGEYDNEYFGHDPDEFRMVFKDPMVRAKQAERQLRAAADTTPDIKFALRAAMQNDGHASIDAKHVRAAGADFAQQLHDRAAATAEGHETAFKANLLD